MTQKMLNLRQKSRNFESHLIFYIPEASMLEYGQRTVVLWHSPFSCYL